jgi:hypothetical protein
MLELTWVSDLLRALSTGYLVLGTLLVLTVAYRANGWRRKTALGMATAMLWVWGPGLLVWLFTSRETLDKTKQHQHQMQVAKARFDELCKHAGERIGETHEVDGVLLMKPGPKSRDYSNVYGMPTAGYGEGYIYSLLEEAYVVPYGDHGQYIGQERRAGYQFVDMMDGGVRYRYTLSFVPKNPEKFESNEFGHKLHKEIATGDAPRYGVTWDVRETPQDRKLWIAGGGVQVIDLQTNNVIAERVGYLMDPYQGDTSGGRGAWDWAINFGPSCPSWHEHNSYFFFKVLKPRRRK